MSPLWTTLDGLPAASAGLFLSFGRLLVFEVFNFFTALFSAALIRFSSSELLSTSSDRYSSTVFQPPSELPAMCISLFLFLSTFSESCKTEIAFVYLPCSIQSTAIPMLSRMSELSSNCNWWPINLNEFSCFLYFAGAVLCCIGTVLLYSR